jgi:ABC-type Mn2+/Zn2+ transport system permease subunit
VIRRAAAVFVAALFGALLGTGTYEVGLPGLWIGPILFAAVVVSVGAARNISRRTRNRIVALTGVVAVVALGVGLTVFS